MGRCRVPGLGWCWLAGLGYAGAGWLAWAWHVLDGWCRWLVQVLAWHGMADKYSEYVYKDES